MENAEKALKQAGLTLEKYKKNKTLVSPEDLAGKYKTSFEKLKHQLKAELEEYLYSYCLDGIRVKETHATAVAQEINRAFEDCDMGRQIGRAAFKDFDLDKVQRLAGEHRRRILEIVKRYEEDKTA